MRKALAWFVCWSGVMIASFISKEGTKEFLMGFCKSVKGKTE